MVLTLIFASTYAAIVFTVYALFLILENHLDKVRRRRIIAERLTEILEESC